MIRFDVVRNIPKNSEMALLAEKYEQLNFSLHGQKQGETQVTLDSRCQPHFVYVACKWFVLANNSCEFTDTLCIHLKLESRAPSQNRVPNSGFMRVYQSNYRCRCDGRGGGAYCETELHGGGKRFPFSNPLAPNSAFQVTGMACPRMERYPGCARAEAGVVTIE